MFLTTDGMLTKAVSREYVQRFSRDARNVVLITGHTAQGTLASNLLLEDYRSARRIRMRADRLTIKVHLDQADVLRLCGILGTRQAMLFHAPEEDCAQLKQRIAALKLP